MDITIQMRSVELLIKSIKRELEGVPQYGYARQKYLTEHAPQSSPLPRCTPEEAGVSSVSVERLFKELAASEELGVHGLMLLRHGHVIAEGCWAPYRPELPHMLYSASKSIVSTAVGIAAEEGLVSTDERLEDIFPGYVKSPNSRQAKLTLRHLLTMSSGVRFNEIGSMLDGDWVRMFMESSPRFEPGAQFEYNSMNTYMLAAALRRKTGMTVSEYLRPRLFEPLGIDNYYWETCPGGTEKGGWGLYLTLEDLAKIAQLYLQKGEWQGRRILSPEWIAEAASPQIPTPNGEMKQGYGYQIWMGRDGAYQFNGAFGQYAIVMPRYDAVAVIFSGSGRLFAQTSLMDTLTSCLWASSDSNLPAYPPAQASLGETISKLRVEPPVAMAGLGADAAAFDRLAEALSGREYRLEPNAGSLFPQTLQSVHGCYSRGADMLRFTKTADGIALTVYEFCECNTIYIRRDGGFTESLFRFKEEAHRVSTRGVWKEEGGEICLALLMSFIETPDTRIVELRISGEVLEAVFDEMPTAERAALMLMELVGLLDDAALKRLAPAVKHLPGLSEDTLREYIRKHSAPRAAGRLIHRRDCL